ncbi:YwqG family protein [Chengkuizengella marina]|uniref:DUF1963 domain-containing protein n=1 Tax=Chengkuizengella marina TaxID=2507566 RepID=A0A6N9Q2L5_9BACL|nr:YwqG family protein [Chengkuizengella marina]NBI28628.1 DUF1963 domain-containing protein [Chengkuizengella marina]
MTKNQKLSLPKELESYREQIQNTVKPSIKITTRKRSTTIHQSKFAGNPFLPKTVEHPKDVEGKPMKLLAQLNFKEIPTLEHMPKEGILQFFISAEDDLMGLDFNDMTKQSNFKILYHQNIIKDESLLITDFSYMDELDTVDFPIEYELALSFDLSSEPVSIGDFRNGELLGESVDLDQMVSREGKDDIELWDLYNDEFLGEGHKIGGYPFFTQMDPREDDKELEEHDILLLQIDTDDDVGIMWGDAGVANFFIRKEDLEKLDFSNVLYNWDCH